jgi:aldose 1-epimerase
VTTLELVSSKHPGSRLVVSSFGAGIRSLSLHGHTIVPDYLGPDAPAYAGVVMFPWAGRVPHGQWTDGAELLELPINDWEIPSALHGLVSSTQWGITSKNPDAVTLDYTLKQSAGYPYSLRIEVTYSLFPDRLEVTDTVTNIGHQVAPFALAHHPYFALGGADLSEVSIDTSIVETMERTPQKIPVAKVEFDRALMPVAVVEIDDTYLLDFQSSDSVTHRMSTPEGTIQLWQGPEWPWLHVYSTPDFPSTSGPIPVVALEPHTAVPNSLNWPEQLISLAPGYAWSGQWGIGFSPTPEPEAS